MHRVDYIIILSLPLGCTSHEWFIYLNDNRCGFKNIITQTTQLLVYTTTVNDADIKQNLIDKVFFKYLTWQSCTSYANIYSLVGLKLRWSIVIWWLQFHNVFTICVLFCLKMQLVELGKLVVRGQPMLCLIIRVVERLFLWTDFLVWRLRIVSI